jgi:hypothetical protein
MLGFMYPAEMTSPVIDFKEISSNGSSPVPVIKADTLHLIGQKILIELSDMVLQLGSQACDRLLSLVLVEKQ